jgi:hypothetical protein
VYVRLVLLIAILIPGCTINFVKKSADPEVMQQKVQYFKWLYVNGFYRSDPEMMRVAASKLLDVKTQRQEDEQAKVDALEVLLKRIEGEIERGKKEKP